MLKPLEVKDRVILEQFELNQSTLGRPLYWNLDNHIIAIEQMICADEIETALKMCDEIPAWYRENYPEELTRLKSILYQNLYDPFDYASDLEEASYTKEDVERQVESGYCYPRLEIIRDVVMAYNNRGLTPWICELSTSHGPIPIGLQAQGLRFHFFGKNLNHQALLRLKPWLNDGIWQDQPHPDQPRIFIFCEALEHSYREEDLKNSYLKLGIKFDDVIISVPNGCLGGGLPNWKTRRLGHLRGYTKKDVLDLGQRFFPGFNFKLYNSISLVLHGSTSSHTV